jgi:hypothetical protein
MDEADSIDFREVGARQAGHLSIPEDSRPCLVEEYDPYAELGKHLQ